MISPRDLVKEVAKLLEEENLCYIDRSARLITSIPMSELDSPEVEAQIDLLEKHKGKYLKIAPMITPALITAMEYFLEEVTDQDVARELGKALKRKKTNPQFLADRRK